MHWSDFLSAGTFLFVIAIYGELRVQGYQHKLMWKDYASRKGIDDVDTSSKSAAA